MDYRSFYLHFECGVCFFNNSVVQEVKKDILDTMEQCSEIPKDFPYELRLWKRILGAFPRLFSPAKSRKMGGKGCNFVTFSV